MPTLKEYLESRRREIAERQSAELLSGNSTKYNQERAAEAELLILMDFLNSADYVKEPVAQSITSANASETSPQGETCLCDGCIVESCDMRGERSSVQVR